MKTDDIATPTESLSALYNQYRSAIGLLSQTNTRRTATARFFISLVSGLVGLLAIVHRPSVDIGTQLWVTNSVALFSIFLSCVWFMTIRSLRHLAAVQRSLLKEMEESLPFAFITRQELLMAQSSSWLDTGKIEQYVPLAMIIPALLILLMTNLG
jgi:hypothetical protein